MSATCAQNVAWQREGLSAVCIAVNLSPRQFTDGGLTQDNAAALQATGLRRELLELEITENMVMLSPELAIKLLHTIKGVSVRLAIDDFGTGCSSLAQLKRFPIDTLKVDRSFIREVLVDTDDNAINEVIIAMANTLGLTVVDEGVDTPVQEAFQRDRECDQIQGYLFSKPVAAEELAALLRRKSGLEPTA